MKTMYGTDAALPESQIPNPESRTNRRFALMWYFSWILGLGLALAFAILNAMWFELHADEVAKRVADEGAPPH
jgi:cyd operon protein YbgT